MRRSVGLLAAALLLGLVPQSSARAAELEPTGSISGATAAKIVKRYFNDEIPESRASVVKTGRGLVMNSDPGEEWSILPPTSAGQIGTRTKDAFLGIDLPRGENASKPTSVSGSAVVYPNTQPGVDTVVAAPRDGVIETFTVIRDADAPKTYTSTLNLPPEFSLQQGRENTAAVLDPEGKPIMLIAAPRARDALGNDVPLSLKVLGRQVIMTVDHDEAAAYPVIADPWYYGSWLNDAEANWCKWPSRFRLCFVAYVDLGNRALRDAEEVSRATGWALHNGGADAFRHCWWSGLMTRRFGAGTAQGFGDRHEDAPQPWAEKDMDLTNNHWGRQWAGGSEGDLWSRCLHGVWRGPLKRIVIP